MARCPHSTTGVDSSGCSQCLGAVPRKVVYDETLGTLTIDGAPASRVFVSPARYGEQQQMHVKKRGRTRKG